MARREAIAAAGALLVAAWVFREATALPFGSLRQPGPGFAPRWAAVTLAGLSVILLVQALRALPSPGSGRPSAPEARGGGLRVAGLVLALAFYVVALAPVGYPISTFLLVLCMRRPTTRRALLAALVLAAAAAAGSYLLFAVWLRVPLPPGPFAG